MPAAASEPVETQPNIGGSALTARMGTQLQDHRPSIGGLINADESKTAIEGALKYAVDTDLSQLNLNHCAEHDRRLEMFVAGLAARLNTLDPALAAKIDAMFFGLAVGCQ